MKIFHISASYKPAYVYGGPTLSVSRLCEGLVKAGNDVEVLTTTANGTEELPVEEGVKTTVDGVPVTYFKRLTKDHTHFSPALFRALMRKVSGVRDQVSGVGDQGSDEDSSHNPQPATHNSLQPTTHNPQLILHIHAWWNLISVFACLIAKRKGVQVVLSPRGTLSGYSFGNRNTGIKAYIHRFLGKKLLQYCHFHVTSGKEKQDILSLLQPKSITIIPNFVYLPEIPPYNSQPTTHNSLQPTTHNSLQLTTYNSHSFRLLFLSRIEEKKGLNILLQALRYCSPSVLRAYNPSVINISLTIAGSGAPEYISRLKSLVLDLKLNINIQWAGQVSQEDKWPLMREHDLLVLPSHDENFANVVIECLAMGTPVLLSKYVGLADYVEQEGLGWICDTRPQSVAEMLLQAIKEQEKRQEIREKAPLKIRCDFDEAVLIKKYEEMYKSLIV